LKKKKKKKKITEIFNDINCESFKLLTVFDIVSLCFILFHSF